MSIVYLIFLNMFDTHMFVFLCKYIHEIQCALIVIVVQDCVYLVNYRSTSNRLSGAFEELLMRTAYLCSNSSKAKLSKEDNVAICVEFH